MESFSESRDNSINRLRTTYIALLVYVNHIQRKNTHFGGEIANKAQHDTHIAGFGRTVEAEASL